MTTHHARLLRSGHDVLACPHCHALAQVDAQAYQTGPITGTAIRCSACGTRGPIEPDVRRAAIAWNNLSRLAQAVERLRETATPRPAFAPGIEKDAPSHADDAGTAQMVGKEAACP